MLKTVPKTENIRKRRLQRLFFCPFAGSRQHLDHQVLSLFSAGKLVKGGLFQLKPEKTPPNQPRRRGPNFARTRRTMRSCPPTPRSGPSGSPAGSGTLSTRPLPSKKRNISHPPPLCRAWRSRKRTASSRSSSPACCPSGNSGKAPSSYSTRSQRRWPSLPRAMPCRACVTVLSASPMCIAKICPSKGYGTMTTWS